MTREAFIRQITPLLTPLRRFLLGLCGGDRMRSEDLSQETLVKAYLAMDSYEARGGCQFSTWLFKIAYNLFLDDVRHFRYDCADMDEASGVAIPASEGADGGFRYEALYRALDRLESTQKAVILMFYINGCSVKEVALTLDLPEGTVKSHLSRGRQRLGQMLQDDNDR